MSMCILVSWMRVHVVTKTYHEYQIRCTNSITYARRQTNMVDEAAKDYYFALTKKKCGASSAVIPDKSSSAPSSNQWPLPKITIKAQRQNDQFIVKDSTAVSATVVNFRHPHHRIS